MTGNAHWLRAALVAGVAGHVAVAFEFFLVDGVSFHHFRAVTWAFCRPYRSVFDMQYSQQRR